MWHGLSWPLPFYASIEFFSMNRRGIVLTILLGLCSVGSAAESMVVTAGLVELKVPIAEKVDVIWESRDPLGLDNRVYQLPDESIFVFNAVPGNRYVISSDRIDWQGHKFERTSYVITVEDGTGPQPPPADDLDLSDFSREILSLAPAGKSSEAAEIADNFATVARRIRAGSVANIDSAFRTITDMNKTTITDPAWNSFGVAVGDELNKARTLDQVAATMDEVVAALEAL